MLNRYGWKGSTDKKLWAVEVLRGQKRPHSAIVRLIESFYTINNIIPFAAIFTGSHVCQIIKHDKMWLFWCRFIIHLTFNYFFSILFDHFVGYPVLTCPAVIGRTTPGLLYKQNAKLSSELSPADNIRVVQVLPVTASVLTTRLALTDNSDNRVVDKVTQL